MSCEFAHLDGAYVLGSLGATERAAYERHLPGCEECSRAVRELAGLPGLLGRVPSEVLELSGEAEPPPATLLPAVVSEVRRSRRRRALVTTLLGAAAAVVLVLGVIAVTVSVLDDDDQPATAPTAPVSTEPPEQMESLAQGSVAGWVSLTEQTWGTRIDLTCTYESQGYDGWVWYALLVRADDGRVEQVGTWRAAPGREMHVTMAASVPPEDIASVVVKTASGQSVLRLDRTP
jgi:hypothetical protein